MKIKNNPEQAMPYIIGDKIRDAKTGRRFDLVWIDYATGDMTVIPNQSDSIYEFWHWSKIRYKYLK